MASDQEWNLDLGAHWTDSNSVQFRVWAPHAHQVSLRLVGSHAQEIPMEAKEFGYFITTVPSLTTGTRYTYLLDHKKTRPDPASRFQPEGVHQASAIIDPHGFRWTDETWKGLPHHNLIIYELHTGTFTKEGTFEAIIAWLDYLSNDVGVTAIELMPVAQFPGLRNWGYDGTHLYAPQWSYGGPEGLKRLVNACHGKGLAVILDVVYNHLGPEGNYLNDFGPYCTNRYTTPWGSTINYDGVGSDEVRHFIINNALYWITEYHVDGLRLDAVHGIFDVSATHILKELQEAVQAQAVRLGRMVSVIAESDLNDVRVIAPQEEGGHGLQAQWNDDFHHALQSVVTDERSGYYADFGQLAHLATALREGYVYSGQRSVHRQRRHGSSALKRPPSQFVVFAQNHDQIGNHARGDRLATLTPTALKVIAATVLLSPNIPLVFMGEEYGERAPFQYFIDHEDPSLVESVRKGRQAELAHFGWNAADLPDPKALTTFEHSRVHPGSRQDPSYASLLDWTRRLIDLRKSYPAFNAVDSLQYRPQIWTHTEDQVLVIHRGAPSKPEGLIILSFNPTSVSITLKAPVGTWQPVLTSSAPIPGPSTVSMPALLSITDHGTSMTLRQYETAVFITAE